MNRGFNALSVGELHALVLALVFSCLLLAAAGDIMMLYLALEMVSITSYVMVAYLKGDRLSNEASLKYVLFGAASTGSMLYGFSLLYGLAGTTSLRGIQEYLAGGIPDANRFAVYAITLVGLGSERLERVPVDGQGRMRADALPALDERTILCLQAGNVNTAAALRAEGHAVLNDVVLNHVLVSFGSPERTRRVIEEIQKGGVPWCGGTVWQGHTTMRISVSSWATTAADVERSLDGIRAAVARAA